MKEKPFGYLRLKSGKFFYDVEGVPNLGGPSSGYIALYTEPQLNSASATWRECCEDWLKRTDWVQDHRKDWPFPTLGLHRAVVMTKYIHHLEELAVRQAFDHADYVLSVCSLTRELDVLINGEEGATKQASLGYTVAQVKRDGLEVAKPAIAQEPVLQGVMRRLADLLDEDQFAEIEGMVVRAGITPPSNPTPAVAQEPVHFRAVLCREQQDQAIGVVPKVVGFVDKKVAEQFILEKRDFQGWRYNLEPLYTEAPAIAHPPAEVVRELVEQLQRMVDFVTTGLEVKEDHPYVEMACATLTKAKEHGL